jgi:hypothetical protein
MIYFFYYLMSKTFVMITAPIIGLLGYGAYYIFKKRRNDGLSAWLEEYINEVSDKLATNKDSPLTIGTFTSLMNLITEIEEYLYNKEYSGLEKKRLQVLKDSDEYQKSVNESIEKHEIMFNKAKDILKKRLNVDCDTLPLLISEKSKDKNYVGFLERNQKNYIDLPILDKETVKNAYMFYVSQSIQKEKVSKNILNFPNFRPEYKDIVLDIYILNKYLLKDYVFNEYGINEKHFYQLLLKHDLLSDPEILGQREILSTL